MTAPLENVAVPLRESMPARRRRAVGVLLAACLFWGASFTWGKNGAANINAAAGLPVGSALGPAWLLAIRFLLAGIVWFCIFRKARRGWSWASVRRVGILGGLLWLSMFVQQLGLDRTSEAVNAFLTSLTILFVPLLQTLFFRRRPGWFLAASAVLAGVGIWLMTGASPHGFGVGEILGLLCSVTFSLHILTLNVLAPRDSAWRLAGGQFLVVGLLCAAVTLALPRGNASLLQIAVAPGAPMNWLLLMIFPTLAGFGAQMMVQPDLDPTRAAIIYLMEPVLAAAYAWIMQGHGLNPTGLLGAGLIVLSNALGELHVGCKKAWRVQLFRRRRMKVV